MEWIDPFSELIEWVEFERGPIRWARLYPHGGHPHGGGWYRVEFYVPDPRVEAGFGPPSRVYSSRVKSFPIFGRAVGVKWKARGWPADSEFGSMITNRLERDTLIAEAITAAGYDVLIEPSPDLASWKLFQFEPYMGWSRARWDCYEAVAQHLLDTPQAEE